MADGSADGGTALSGRHRASGGTATISLGDSLEACAAWPGPTCIVADGPYGLGKFPGEPRSTAGLAAWYRPHAEAWARRALPCTTLWFWNSEIGWAMSHPALAAAGWEYEQCVVWDKGVGHVAGNVNSRTIRGLPVVTEVAVRYVRRAELPDAEGRMLPLRDWLRAEWRRSGLPMHEANRACGVASAATRKYLCADDVWYFPPGEALAAMAAWCRDRGAETARPYFSLDGATPPDAAAWERMRAKWNHAHGVVNVWREPALRGAERLKAGTGAAHANQKPLALVERQILASTDPGDVVWEPFGGTCTASLAAALAGRHGFGCEINPDYFAVACGRARGLLEVGGGP